MRLDVMVDIETLGKESDSTIFQIAAIAFDLETGEHYYKFNESADIAQDEKLIVDGDTLKWWLQTDKELLAKLLNKGSDSSSKLLKRFHQWLDGLKQKYGDKNIYLWGNGILFDNKMIQYQMQSLGLEYPIYYKNDRDVRTILELVSLRTGKSEQEIKEQFDDDSLIHHNAIDDVTYQINLVVGCFNMLMSKGVMEET